MANEHHLSVTSWETCFDRLHSSMVFSFSSPFSLLVFIFIHPSFFHPPGLFYILSIFSYFTVSLRLFSKSTHTYGLQLHGKWVSDKSKKALSSLFFFSFWKLQNRCAVFQSILAFSVECHNGDIAIMDFWKKYVSKNKFQIPADMSYNHLWDKNDKMEQHMDLK